MKLVTSRVHWRQAAAVGFLQFLAVQSLWAQSSPATLPDIKLTTSGTVSAIAVQGDGKVIVGGSFSSVNGITRSNLARLNPNGSVDATWDPGADGAVRAVVVSGTDVYVGGDFQAAGGLRRNRLAKLSTTGGGGADPLWDPNPQVALEFPASDPAVNALVLSGSDLYVGGAFSQIGGLSLTNIARIHAVTGMADSNWTPDAIDIRDGSDGAVSVLALSGENLFVGGSFSRIGGLDRNGIAKLSTSGRGRADSSWHPGTGGATRVVATAFGLGDTSLYVGGNFTWFDDQFVNGLVKLSTTGAGPADRIWNPYPFITNTPFPSVAIRALAVSQSAVYVGGNFNQIGGQNRSGIAKLSLIGTGAVDGSWSPILDSDPSAITLAGSAIYIGGAFHTVNDSISLGIAKLDEVSSARDPSFPAQVQRTGVGLAIARQPDGKVVVGGDFSLAGDLPRRNLARINVDGTINQTWFPGANGAVSALAATSSDVFVGGDFTRIGGQARNGIAKLPASGTDAADPSWNPVVSGRNLCGRLVVDGTNLFATGIQVIEGDIISYYLSRMSTLGLGTVKRTWTSAAPTGPMAVDGSNLYVSGNFRDWETRVLLVKFSTMGDGEIDPTWNPFSTNTSSYSDITALALSGTNLFVAGGFTNVGGQPVTNLAKLNTVTAEADPAWKPVSGDRFGTTISALAISGTNLYVAGRFSSMGGHEVTNLAKVSTKGTGRSDPDWQPSPNGFGARALSVHGTDLYAAGIFTTIGDASRIGLALLSVADAPVLIQGSNSTLVITRNADDGAEVTHFRITAIAGATLFQSDGLTPVRESDFISVAAGAQGLTYVLQGGTNSFVSAVSALNDTPAGAGTAVTTSLLNAAQVPVFTFSNSVYRVSEGGGPLTLHVRKSRPGVASVTVVTADGTASGGPDYQVRSNVLNFASTETTKSVTIGIVNNFETEGDRTFLVRLLNPTAGATIGSPGVATVTIIDNDGVGLPDSFTVSQLPNPPAPPPSSGVLVVELQPPSASGQWRLAGEFAWHDSSAVVRGLVTGNYRLEFKPVNGFLEPPSQTVPVASGTSNHLAAFYTATAAASTGELTALINPPDVATNLEVEMRGQWRRQGESAWRESGERISNLSAGIHLVEFKPVAGRATPPTQNVSVISNQNNVASGTYLYSTGSPGLPPVVLSFSNATTVEPYLYNGQIQTDLGFGSGVVVKPRVVLTAAHVLFNDALLGFVGTARWFFQKHKGDLEPLTQTPRGWYIFDGYAAQRQADNNPGVSTPGSQALDAAAMYFVETPTDPNLPGRGGFGGFLASDDLDNPWLTGNQLKMLVGYPIDTITGTNQGRMHATVATNATFTSLSPGVFSTTDLKSYPGNSGGPLYAQYDDGKFYPAGIYLGGSAQTLVRAIDSQVVDLINRAEISGNGGGNHTGGGVALWSPGLTGSPFVPGLFRVNFVPADLSGKAGWRVRGADDPTWIGSSNLYFPLIPGPFNIEFKPLPGYSAPPFRRIEVVADQTTLIDALYNPIRLSDARTLPNGIFQLTLNGGRGRAYSVQWSREMVNWSNLVTLTNLTGVTNVSDAPATSHDRRFYRAVEW